MLSFEYKTLGPSSALGDFNGDHVLDIAVMLSKLYQLKIFFGTGNGTFKSTSVSTRLKEMSGHMKVIDLNKDGHLNVIIIWKWRWNILRSNRALDWLRYSSHSVKY